MQQHALRILLATAALAALPGLFVAARADDELLRIETEYVVTAGHHPAADDPADRLAASQPLQVPMEPTPPPGTASVPEGRERLYGAFEITGRKVPFVLAVRDGNEAILAFDPEGDGSIGGPGAEARSEGRPGKSQGRAVVRWTFSGVPVGDARVDVAVHRTLPDRQAVLVRSEPAPIALGDALPEGTRLFDVKASPVAFGEAGGLPLAFVRGDGDRLTLLLDENENGVVGESGEVIPMPVAGRDGDTTYWQVQGIPLPSGAASIAFQEIPGSAVGYLRPSGARRGRAQVDGRTFHLHLLDADLDGRYATSGDLWWFGPTEHLQQVRRLVPDSMVEADEPIFIGGRAWRIVSVDRGGAAVLMVDPNAGTVDAYFERRSERVNRERWWPTFRAEEADFRREHGIDPARPKAAAAVPWHHDVDLAAALAQARRENKPVLADFEADWCAWCKRFDYYVYGDQEVAELLRRFVLVKINNEFHFSGDYQRLGGKGLPFLIFLRPDGSPLEIKIPDGEGRTQTCSGPPGFQPPREFAATLRAALASWESSR